MPITVEPKEIQNCSIDCPYRKRDTVLGVDLFEVVLWALLSLPVGITIKDAWTDNLTFRDSVERIAMLSGLGGFIRLSPTERVSHFLGSFRIGRK